MNSLTAYAIDTIKDYINHVEETGQWYWSTLAQRSFVKWAAMSLIERMQQCKDRPPLMIIESFKEDMYMYSCSNERTELLFATAIEAAEDIEDLLVG